MKNIMGNQTMKFTAIIERDGTGYVALCPELGIATQGNDIPTTRNNLREAIELFLECASSKEIQQRFFTRST